MYKAVYLPAPGVKAEISHQEEGYCPIAGAQGKEFKSSEEEPYYRARGSSRHAVSSTYHRGK